MFTLLSLPAPAELKPTHLRLIQNNCNRIRIFFGSFDTKYLHFGVLYLSDFFWQNVLKLNFSDVLCKGHSRAEVLYVVRSVSL